MIDLLSETCEHIPEVRRPDRVDYSRHDTLMSGFAMMFFQHASLLELQRKMSRGVVAAPWRRFLGCMRSPPTRRGGRFWMVSRWSCCVRGYQRSLKRGAERAGPKTLRARCRAVFIKVITLRRCSTAVTIFPRPRGNARGVYNAPIRGRGAFPSHRGIGHPGQSRVAPRVAPRCGKSASQRWPGPTRLRRACRQTAPGSSPPGAPAVAVDARGRCSLLPRALCGELRDLGRHHVLVGQPTSHGALYEWVEEIER
jgi:hypothetical protein